MEELSASSGLGVPSSKYDFLSGGDLMAGFVAGGIGVGEVSEFCFLLSEDEMTSSFLD